MTTQTIDDGAGFLARRHRRIQAAGIRAIGPTDLHPVPPKPVPADRIRRHRALTGRDKEHRATVAAELAAIDAHADWIREQLGENTGPDAGLRSFQDQELAAELRQLGLLRVEIEADTASPAPADDRMRAIVRARSKELAEQFWRGAGRAAAEGDHRHARQLRHDALRAQRVAERESGIRTSLRGYA